MEREWNQEKTQQNEIPQKYRKYGLQTIEKNYTKEGKYTGKNKSLIELDDKNRNEMMKKDGELNGEEGGENTISRNIAIITVHSEFVKQYSTLETRIKFKFKKSYL